MRFSRALLAVIAVATACIALRPAGAQEPSLRVEVVSVSEAGYPTASATVNVEDSASASPRVLGAGDFAVALDGSPAHVVSAELASSEDEPLYVLFVIDTSGSMEGAPLAAAKSAAQAFVSELDPKDLVGVMHFGNAVALKQDFTSDRALISAAIDSLVAEGNTALYQATADGAQKIASVASSRRAVVLLSDGADFGGKSIATREEALYGAAASGAPYFVIAQGTDLDRPYLQQLGDVTRGRYLEAPQPAELEAIYVGIGRLLRSQYVVTFDASGLTAGVEAKVSVTATDGNRTSPASEWAFTPPASFAPQFTVEGLEEGEEITQARQLTLSVSSGTPKVAWYVDGVNVAENDAPPFVFTYDPSLFVEGPHTLTVSIGSGASPFEQTLNFRSVPPPPVATGGGPPVLLIACGIAGAIALVVAVLWFRSRRPKKERGISPDQRVTPWAAQMASKAAPVEGDLDESALQEDIGVPLGVLVARGGSESGKEYLVGGKPVGIGAGPRCGVRINDPELSFEEARTWVRGEHLMLRKKTRLSRLEAAGEVGGWQILGVGDTFQVGGHTFEFKLLPHPGEATTPEPAPNILRDREGPQSPQPSPQRFSDLMPRSD